ncbi:MAG TPA: MGMT family protein [Candidatus Omnitrophota bacterium]|nr:MGMT family protein [Candidatus Omnitrophota bacterium]
MSGKFSKGLTDFEWAVLKATLEIPLGETRSYKWVAERIGRPQAARAVGQALRKNPYPIIIPCHRVIKANGDPGGYGGKQDPRKARLLAQERDIAARIRLLGARGGGGA